MSAAWLLKEEFGADRIRFGRTVPEGSVEMLLKKFGPEFGMWKGIPGRGLPKPVWPFWFSTILADARRVLSNRKR